MKAVLALAVLAYLAVGAYGTAQFVGLFTDATKINSLTLDSSEEITATNWGVSIITSDSTYRGDENGNPLTAVFNVTWSGGSAAFPNDGSVTPSAYITFSQAPYVASAGCTGQGNGFSFGSGVFDNTGNYLTYHGSVYAYFTTAGTVTATISIQYPPRNQIASRTFDFTVTNPYTPTTAGIAPTVSSFSAPSLTNSIDYAGSNVSIAGATPGNYYVQLYYTANTGNQGVAWAHQCTVTVAAAQTTGSCLASDFSTLTAMTGSWCGNVFVGQTLGSSWTAGVTLTLRSVTIVATDIDDGDVSVSYAGNAAPFNSAQVRITDGSTDNTPPTCDSALFATPLAVPTAGLPPPTRVVTISCTDGTGSGLDVTGVFFHAQSTGGLVYESSQQSSVASSTFTYTVPLHYDGTVSIKGVWAIDNNGNAVVYGNCIYGVADTICGGNTGASASSAVVASISLVIALILAVLAL